MQDVTPPGMPPQMQFPVHEQILINNALIEVQRAPDGSRVLVQTLPNGRRYVTPMPAEVAKEIGMKLAAPGIVAPNGAPPAHG